MNRTLAVVAALVVLPILTLAILPAHYAMERSIDIASPPEVIAAHVANLPLRETWVAWKQKDPGAKYAYTGTPAAVGSTMHWSGDVIGSASVTLDALSDDRVTLHVDYEKPMAMRSTDTFILEPLANGTTHVRWANSADLTFGPQRLFGLFADRVMGDDYAAGLATLKTQLEASTVTQR